MLELDFAVRGLIAIILYFLLCLLPDRIMMIYFDKLRRLGIDIKASMSIFVVDSKIVIPKTRTELFIKILELGVYIPFLEETLFRYVPFFVGYYTGDWITGIIFAFIGSILWGQVHLVKFYAVNRTVLTRYTMKPLYAWSINFFLSGLFFSIALALWLPFPYLFHVFHNSLVVYSMYSESKVNTKKAKEFIETSSKEPGKKVSQELPKPKPQVPASIVNNVCIVGIDKDDWIEYNL